MSGPVFETYNPYQPIKKAEKHSTSNWPFFSHYLDEKFELYSAPLQYLTYVTVAASVVGICKNTYLLHKTKRMIPKTPIDAYNQTEFMNTAKLHRVGSLVSLTFFPFFIMMYGSYQRVEELDKTGERFKEYYKTAMYSGLVEDTAALIARDIVIRSKTKEEGKALLEHALKHLDEIEEAASKVKN